MVPMVLEDGSIPAGVNMVILSLGCIETVMSFVTATLVNGILHRSYWKIGREYLETWLLLDLLVVLPGAFKAGPIGDGKG